MAEKTDSIDIDRTPHASPACSSDADHAGSFFVDTFGKADNIDTDRTPHASPACSSDADRAGSFFSSGKQFLTYQELWRRLLNKGMSAGSYTEESFAALCKRHGYYRIRGYWITLQNDRTFVSNASIDDVVEIMRFDKDLANFILEAVFYIELSLRETLSYYLSGNYGPYPLEIKQLFNNQQFFGQLQKTLSRELAQGARYKFPYVTHYLDKGEKLPIWANVGLMSFGTVSKIYRNIGDINVAKALAGEYDLKVPTMANWLRYLTQLRNICAHQDRVYNIVFTTRPRLFREHRKLDTARLFPAFIVIFHMLESIDPERAAAMRVRFGQIMDAHAGVDLRPVGFPENWRDYIPGTFAPTASNDGKGVRDRRGNAGRKRKNQAAIDEALRLYDANACSIAEIAKRTGVGHSTLYKYLNLRKIGSYPHYEYALEKIDGFL